MSKKITKEISKKFVDGLTNEFIKIGAKIKCLGGVSNRLELDTVAGKLNISIPVKQSTIFSVFGRFEDVDKAKTVFDCNPYSGKFNVFMGLIPEMTVEDYIAGFVRAYNSK
jgi:hypothetical protein